jgi:hypothetical protein
MDAISHPTIDAGEGEGAGEGEDGTLYAGSTGGITGLRGFVDDGKSGNCAGDGAGAGDDELLDEL